MSKIIKSQDNESVLIDGDLTVGTGLIVTDDSASSITIDGEIAVNTTDLVVDSSGNVGIGTASPGTNKLKVDGNINATSLTLGAGTDLLGVYETGTWTPQFGTASSNFTLTGEDSGYIRIGKLVVVTTQFTVLSGSLSGQLRLKNLPFTNAYQVTGSVASDAWNLAAGTIDVAPLFIGTSGQTALFFRMTKDDASTDTVDASAISDNDGVTITVVYITE